MPMSEEHKAALARGRKEARAIKTYLNVLDSRKPGPPVTKESLESRFESVNNKLDGEYNVLNRVELLQKKLDIEEGLSAFEDALNFDELEEEFIKHAKSFSERKGISYTAWRNFGVPAAALKNAGIPETRCR